MPPKAQGDGAAGIDLLVRPFDLIIFDCDGVVVDSEPISNRVFREFLGGLGLELSEREVYARFLGRSMAESLATVEVMTGRAVAPQELAAYKADRDRILREEVTAVDGITTLIATLDVPYCIASSGDHDKMRATLGATGLLPLFEGRLFSATDVARAKPAPDVFLHAAARMAVAPARALVIEDSVNGVKAARAAGMTVYAYAGLTPAAQLAAAGAHAIFTHMRELESMLEAG